MLILPLPSCALADGEAFGDESETKIDESRKKLVEIDGFIFNLPHSTKISDFLATYPEFVSTSSKGEFIATGDTLIAINGKSYTAVIHGDGDGDGQITALDYILVRRLYMQTVTLDTPYALACSLDLEVTPYDYLYVKRQYFGTFDITTLTHREGDEIDFDMNTADKIDGNGIKIAYIPLDNRPVNKDRVEYLAQAAGFELFIPEEELYRTALDNMTPNSDGSTLGNREELLKWLKSVEDDCDYFVISLDQLISGGLVGSRYLSNTDLTFETEVADYIIELAASKHVVLFDTVMRLASTVGYQGYDLNTYNALRSYGQVAREQLSGDQLTVENIIAGYRYNTNGKLIQTSVSNQVLDQYLASRERKLKVIDYLLTHASEDIEKIYIGVDDSSPQTTIQTNEINYITSIAGENMTLFAGADELGLMGIAAVATDVYGQAECNVTYFGGGENLAADEFDTDTLKRNVEKHCASINATVNSDAKDALQVLILTRTSNASKDANSLIKQAMQNLENGIPTCIIDASGSQALAEAMLNNKFDIALVLGYSNWNTVGNALGISLSNAVARYMYIYNCKTVTEASNEGFLKAYTFSLIKDISYKRKGISNLNDSSAYGPKTIVSRINSSNILVADGVEASHNKVSVSNFRYPWNRSFEATFDITIS